MPQESHFLVSDLKGADLSYWVARANMHELLHPMRSKGWSFTGVTNPRLGQFLTGY